MRALQSAVVCPPSVTHAVSGLCLHVSYVELTCLSVCLCLSAGMPCVLETGALRSNISLIHSVSSMFALLCFNMLEGSHGIMLFVRPVCLSIRQ